ncbi:ATP-binding protein [uncultured Paludibaculum sp.]|uniref:ATP-binding protein n=1 Tax=uncultured Paludibaculum sp. TaxID=1765020 RepID=UPI002AAB6339|nr:ATP-binding protein [uncultured Paludibaculum sp.]
MAILEPFGVFSVPLGRFLAQICRCVRMAFLPVGRRSPALILTAAHLASLCAAQDVPLSRDYVVTNWQTEQGLPENSATSVVHSPDGFLWFGTFRGLVRFDGHKFTVFDQRRIPVLPDPGIVSVHQDRAGQMWISTLAGLVYGHENSWVSVGAGDGWTGKYVRHFADAADGSLFLSTFDHRIFRFSSGKFVELPAQPGRADPTFLFPDRQGRVVAVNRDYYSTWTTSGWQSLKLPTEIGLDPLPAWGLAKDGLLWSLRGGRLYKLDRNRVVSTVRLTQSTSNVWTLTEDAAGLLWAPSYRFGLYRIQPTGEVNRYSTATDLPSNGVRFVYADHRGNRWIGTDGGGLLRIREKRFQTVGSENGLPGFPVKAVAPAHDGTVYIGTYGAGLFSLRGGRITNIPIPDRWGLYPQSLLIDHSGLLWIGTFGAGLFQLRGQSFLHPLKESDGWSSIETLFEDSKGAIWLSETTGRTARFEGSSLQTYAAPDKGGGVPIRCFAESRETGQIWAAGDAGLLRFDGKGFRRVNDVDGHRLPPLITIFPLDRGDLWLAPATGGLLLWRNGRALPINSARTPPAIVGGIVEERGNTWMATNRGVWRFRKSDLLQAAPQWSRQVEWQHFDRDDGLPSVECSLDHQPIIQFDRDGRIWIATLKGAALVDPNRLGLHPEPVPVRMEAVSYLSGDGAQHRISVSDNQTVHFPPGSLDIRVSYTALDLSNQNKVVFAYALHQAGRVIVQAERSEREISFAQLAPGDYSLALRVRSSDGFWNATTLDLPLVMEAHPWETAWFRTGLALLTLSGIIGLAFYGSRRYTRNQMRELSRDKQRAEAEARLLQSTRMESIGRLAGGVAHDFNNLLTIVNGYSEILLLELPPNNPMRGHVESIRSAGQRAAELTRQLLSFSRSQPVSFAAMEVNSAVRDTATLLQRMVGETVYLELHLDENPGTIKGDSSQLGQLLLNLVVNARDAMPNGGKIVIRTSAAQLSASDLASNPDLKPGAYVALSVEDSGTGMDRETLRHAFEPFFTTKPVGKGTGMGLAIVYGVVKRCGGKIEVNSEVGRGSKFTVYFPTLDVAPVRAEGPEQPLPPVTGHETILLVEDDPAVRRVTAGILSANGYRVLEAGGGQEAIAVASREGCRPDLLLSDVVMPGMSGYALAERLSMLLPRLRILLVSGYSGFINASESSQYAAVRVLPKPFTASALLSAVREVLTQPAQLS